jgi:DNA-binding transcriptional ArsR family regulator/rhodanese-related sulfurtransferase
VTEVTAESLADRTNSDPIRSKFADRVTLRRPNPYGGWGARAIFSTLLGPAAQRRYKNDIYGALARVPAAIANPHRLELLELLAQRSRTVADIAAETALSIANASQHLKVLTACGLVTVERRGTYAFYRITGDKVFALLRSVREVAEENDTGITVAVKKHLGAREKGIADYEVVRALIADPHVALLDTRVAEEYVSGHLPRAINAPLAELKSGKVMLPKSKRYVAYCRGPYCTFADEAVEILRGRGFEAERLALGPIEWEAAGEELSRAG